MRPLIAKHCGLLVSLVVIDAKDTAGKSAQRNQTAGLRREITRARMTQSHVRLESMQIDRTYPRSDTVELRIVPGDWKCDRRVEQDAEVVRTVCVFPKIIRIDDEPAPDPLL